MAQSLKCKQMHAEQVAAAQEIFESYKKFIVEEFVSKFGASYEKPDKLPTKWQEYYEYKPECEEFLIEKSKTFIHVAPAVDRKFKSPTFLRNLTSLISEHLSSYIAKKGWKRNDCTKYLQEILFVKNRHVQIETSQYVATNNREWGLKQKARREQAEQKNKRKRERINPSTAKPVDISKNEQRKIHTKSVNARLKEKRKELKSNFVIEKAVFETKKIQEKQKLFKIEIFVTNPGR